MKEIKLGFGKVAMQIAKDETGVIGILFKEFDHEHGIGSGLGDHEDETRLKPDVFISFDNIASLTVLNNILSYTATLMSGASKTDWHEHPCLDRADGMS